jgi:hypothetical protein
MDLPSFDPADEGIAALAAVIDHPALFDFVAEPITACCCAQGPGRH